MSVTARCDWTTQGHCDWTINGTDNSRPEWTLRCPPCLHSSVKCQAKYFCCPVTTNSSNACCPLNDVRNWFAYSSACISCHLSPPCRRLCTLAVSPNFRHQQHPYMRTTRPGRSARSQFPLLLVLVKVTYRCPLGVFLAIESRINHTD